MSDKESRTKVAHSAPWHNWVLMPSPLVSLQALLELRALLDSLPAGSPGCQRLPQIRAETTALPAAAGSTHRQTPQTRKPTDEPLSFQ